MMTTIVTRRGLLVGSILLAGFGIAYFAFGPQSVANEGSPALSATSHSEEGASPSRAEREVPAEPQIAREPAKSELGNKKEKALDKGSLAPDNARARELFDRYVSDFRSWSDESIQSEIEELDREIDNSGFVEKANTTGLSDSEAQDATESLLRLDALIQVDSERTLAKLEAMLENGPQRN